MDQILTRFDFQRRRFENYKSLADAVFAERASDLKEAQSEFVVQANKFLATYKTVIPGGDGGSEEPMSASELREKAKEISDSLIQEFKETPTDFLLEAVGFGGPAAMIENQILDRLRPYMQRSLKSMVPMSWWRRKLLTGVKALEGVVDIVYNSCGLVVEVMTAEAAAPAVAGIGAASKGMFSKAKSKISGRGKDESDIEAAVTVGAEFAQGMVPIGGSVMGIGGGIKQLGDPEVVALLNKQIEKVDPLIDRGRLWARDSKELENLRTARHWLLVQITKTEERRGGMEGSGTMPLLFE